MSKTIKSEHILKMKSSSFKIGIVETLAGLVLFLLPQLLPGIIMLTMGIIFTVVAGIYLLILVRRPKEITQYHSYILPIGLLLLGIYTIINPNNVVSIIAWIFGAGTIIKGIFTLLSIGSPLRTNGYKLAGLFSIIVGIIIIYVSGSAGELFSYFIGFSLFFNGILDIFSARDLGKIVKISGTDDYVIK